MFGLSRIRKLEKEVSRLDRLCDEQECRIMRLSWQLEELADSQAGERLLRKLAEHSKTLKTEFVYEVDHHVVKGSDSKYKIKKKTEDGLTFIVSGSSPDNVLDNFYKHMGMHLFAPEEG